LIISGVVRIGAGHTIVSSMHHVRMQMIDNVAHVCSNQSSRCKRARFFLRSKNKKYSLRNSRSEGILATTFAAALRSRRRQQE
jgi:hypothetical protein